MVLGQLDYPGWGVRGSPQSCSWWCTHWQFWSPPAAEHFVSPILEGGLLSFAFYRWRHWDSGKWSPRYRPLANKYWVRSYTWDSSSRVWVPGWWLDQYCSEAHCREQGGKLGVVSEPYLSAKTWRKYWSLFMDCSICASCCAKCSTYVNLLEADRLRAQEDGTWAWKVMATHLQT